MDQKQLQKNSKNLNIIDSFDFNDTITCMEFSPDSTLILVVLSKKGVLQIKSTIGQKWDAKIEDQASGIIGAKWCPDSRQVIVFSDFGLKATIYSLADKSQQYIKCPKYADKGIQFSQDGKFMALVERQETKDYIGIYYTKDWKLLNHFQVETLDLQDILWSKNSMFILAWDNSIQYKFLMFCPNTGLIFKYQPYDFALGIKYVAISNNSSITAIGSYDEKIRLVNNLSLKLITELEHKSNLGSYQNLVIYKEEDFKDNQQLSLNNKTTTRYVIVEEQLKLKTEKYQNDKPNPPIGISDIQWSYDDNFIASKSCSMPNTIWIWEISTLELKSVLIHQNPVKTFMWSPSSLNLVICTGKNQINIWSPDAGSICDLPFQGKLFNVNKLQWSQNGKVMILTDKIDIVIAYPPIELIGEQSEVVSQQQSQFQQQQLLSLIHI
eukprot:TRINITY_DN12947_c0_g1_i4.p1 TRINITY_DN12947_c0_g1~~TRINITY_DN12947_c0_g1_i4.p1  ORF type:complete len:438 (+),score=78.06 TRINITY_DN12947_c0_g1_i4:103-1416(+)